MILSLLLEKKNVEKLSICTRYLLAIRRRGEDDRDEAEIYDRRFVFCLMNIHLRVEVEGYIYIQCSSYKLMLP